MNIFNHPVAEHCRLRFLQFRTALAATVQRWFARGRVVVPAAVRFLCGGLRTRTVLTRKMGEPWVSRNFPDLQPRQLLRSACHMVPLIWTEPEEIPDVASPRIPPPRLKQIKRKLRQLPRHQGAPCTAAARQLQRAAFARFASAVMGCPVPKELVSGLRSDRCLRDLLMTWIDIVLVTTMSPNAHNMRSSLAVHASLTLPAGDQLPARLRRRLGSARMELATDIVRTETASQTDALQRRVRLASSEVLTVPMAFMNALKKD